MAHFNTSPFRLKRLAFHHSILRSCAVWLVVVFAGLAPSTSWAQMERLYLRHSQNNPGAGGIVRDLLPTQGSSGTVNTSNTSSSSFSERLAFTIDHSDLPTAIGGTSFNVSMSVSDRSSFLLAARFRLQRTNSGGVVQASSAYSNEFNSTGTKTASFTLPEDWGPGDRLRLSVEVRSTLGSNRNITIRTGNVNSWVDYVPYNPCTGTPAPGNTLASVSSICATEPFNLSLQNATPGDGVGYQWQSSLNGTDWANVNGANSPGLNTSLTETTWYRCQVTCQSNTGVSAPVQVAAEICYCAAGATSNNFERITRVRLADIDRSSTGNVGYEDHTSTVGTLMSGVPYFLTVDYGFSGATTGYPEDQVLVWIDLNRNGSFTDAGEQVYVSPLGQSPRTGIIIVPTGTEPGTTRMRVRLHDAVVGTPNATPCGNSTYGQVEDYTVNIVPSVLYSAGSGSAIDAIWAYTPDGPANGASVSVNTKVIIQAGHTVTVNDITLVDDLVLEAGGTLVLEEEQVLIIKGNEVILNGTVTGLGTLSLEGVSATTLTTTGVVNLHNLTNAVADGTAVAGTVRIQGTLELVDGAFDATNANVILRSTANGTGRLGTVGAGASYIGDLTAQRRVPGGVTNWRLMGSPVDGMTVADWNDDFFTAGFPGSNYPNFYSGGVLWPSIRWYDETNTGASEFDGLVGVSGTAQALERGRGYAVWSGDASGGTQAFVVDVTGAPTIAHSPIALPITWTNTGNGEVDGLNLVSNPLPSPIAFSQVTRGADVENAYWIYNPTNGNNASWNGVVGTNGANGIIQSSQGFWLKANGPAVNTTVSEDAKVAGNTGGLFGGPAQLEGVLPMLRLKVSSGMNTFTDETVVVFQDGTPAFEAGDVEKFVFSHPSAPQIATRSSDAHDLAINMYGMYDNAISIPVLIVVPMNGTFTITATALSGVDGVSCLVLEDLVTGNITPLTSGAEYNFTMLANADASQPRFMLHATAPVQQQLTDVSCHGAANGEAMVQVPSGQSFDVTWMDAAGTVIGTQEGSVGSATISTLAVGNYMVSVNNDAACGALTSAFTIAEPFALEATYQVVDASCPDAFDGSITAVVLGGTAPYSLMWTNGGNGAIIDAAAGLHMVTISDSKGCMISSDMIEVGSAEAPVAQFELQDLTVMAGQPTVFLNMSGPADEYVWDLGDGATSTAMEPVHVYSLPGTYSVVLTVTNGACSSMFTQDVTVQVSTDLGSAMASGEMHAWSTSEAFLVALPTEVGAVDIRLYDAAGRLHLSERQPGGALLTIPAHDLGSGIWFLTVDTGAAQKTFRLPLVR